MFSNPHFMSSSQSCSAGGPDKVLSEGPGAIKAALLVSRPLTYRVHSVGYDICFQVIKKKKKGCKMIFPEVNSRTMKQGLSEAAFAESCC